MKEYTRRHDVDAESWSEFDCWRWFSQRFCLVEQEEQKAALVSEPRYAVRKTSVQLLVKTTKYYKQIKNIKKQKKIVDS